MYAHFWMCRKSCIPEGKLNDVTYCCILGPNNACCMRERESECVLAISLVAWSLVNVALE